MNIESAKKEAKRLKKLVQAGDPAAVARYVAAGFDKQHPISHSTALNIIARENGAKSWADFLTRKYEPRG